MPTKSGPHWFTKELKDRDIAVFIGVSGRKYHERDPWEFMRGYDTVIQSDEGWWLAISDYRRTAAVATEEGLCPTSQSK